jgi:esterase/lipase
MPKNSPKVETKKIVTDKELVKEVIAESEELNSEKTSSNSQKSVGFKKSFVFFSTVISVLLLIWLVGSTILYFISGSQIFHQERSYNVEIPGTTKYFIKNKDNKNLEVVVQGSLQKEAPVINFPTQMPMFSSINSGNVDLQNLSSSLEGLTSSIKKLTALAPQKQTFVIYLHGNSGRIPHFFEQFSQYSQQHNLPLTVVSPSYPGFGLSEGEPNTENVYDTGVKTYDWLISQGIEPSQIIVLGHSLGGSPAVYLASQRPQIAKLVLVNTFSSVTSMCFRQYSIFCSLSTGILNTAQSAKKVETKVRQFAYKNDDNVPFEEGKTLFNYFEKSKDKKFTELPGDTHSYFDMNLVLQD